MKFKELQIQLENEEYEIKVLNDSLRELEESYEEKRDELLKEIEEHQKVLDSIKQY